MSVGSRVEVWPSQRRLLQNVLRDLVGFAVLLAVVAFFVGFGVLDTVLPAVLGEWTILVLSFFFGSFHL